MQTETPTLQPAPLPTFNPPQVVIRCDQYLEIVHGFTDGGLVKTVQQEISSRDNNGFDIWVRSPLQQRDVWLSSNHYELLKDKTTEVSNG